MSRPTTGTVSIEAGGDRWRAKAKLIEGYRRRQMKDAENERARVYPDTHAEHIQRTVPLIWRISRELSTLYLRKPSRSWERDGETVTAAVSKAIEDVYAEARVDQRLRTSQEQWSCVQNATPWVWLTATGFRLICIPVHDQWVRQARIDACEVEDISEWRIKFPVPGDPFVDTAETAIALITPTRAVWESGPAAWAGKGIWAEDGSNPFGRIPVVMLRATDPAPGEWWAPVPEDMLDSQRAVDHDFTDIGTIARLQGYAQAVVVNMTQEQAKLIDLGPQKAVGVPADGDFKYASPSPDLAGYQAQLDGFLKLTIACNGMNPATVMKSSGITALAKIIEIMDRDVERQRAIVEFTRGEQLLYELMAQADAIRNGGAGRLPEGLKVRIEYREPVTPADPTSDAQAKAQRIGQNLDTAATVLARELGISHEDAEALVMEYREFNARVRGAGGLLEEVETMPAVVPQALDIVAGTDVQATALNGAQVQSMQAILASVAGGLLPSASARAMLLAAFPIDERAADAMLAPLSGFTITPPPRTDP